MPTQRFTHQQINELDAYFQRTKDAAFAWRTACSACMALSGLRLFVPTSGFDSAGNATDLGGLDHHLTYNGNPTYNYDGLAPYIDLDGAGDYLSHIDHADFDVLGTESYVAAAARGLAFGGWCWFDNAATGEENVITKWGVAGQRSYRIVRVAGGQVLGQVSVDGTAVVSATSAIVPVATWLLLYCTFGPGAELNIYVNDTRVQNVVGIPASIFNSNAIFGIGRNSAATGDMDGRASMVPLAAEFHTKAQVLTLFHHTRPLFGVS